MTQLHLSETVKIRKDIPFFYSKSEAEFRADKYEYIESVNRQLILHLADQYHINYPFQSILDWIFEKTANSQPDSILEIGCSIGRMISELAKKHPKSNCWGIDYSYQLLRQANDFYVKGKDLKIDGRDKGFKQLTLQGKQLSNLHFGLARGEQLPFEKESLDLVFSSFTLDRFEEPILVLQEVFRVLKKGGNSLIISPLNFQKKEHWKAFFPVKKLEKVIKEIGFTLKSSPETFLVKEPLDGRGNHLNWECVGFVLRK